MAVDLEKYRKKEPTPGAAPVAPTGAVDINKYRKQAPQTSTFNVPEPANYRENRIKQFQSEQVGYDAATKEANSPMGFLKNFGKGLVKAIAPSEVGLGKTIAGVLYQGGKEDKALQETVATGEDVKVNLLKTIREQEAQGKDTTRLKQAYNEQEKNVANTARTARDLVQLPTTAQAVGQIAGTGLDILTAGTYSKAKTAPMASGRLFSGATPAVKTLATAAGAPELGAIAGQKAGGLFSLRGVGNIAKGATTGYATDVALGLQGERGTEREGTKAFIPGLSTALGTAIPVASEATKTFKNIINPTSGIVEKRLNALTDLETKNGKVARVFDAADRRGIDVRKTLAETNLLNGAVDTDGRISSDKALNNFNEFIAPYEGRVKEALTAEGRSIQLNQLADEAKSFIDNSTLSDRQKIELQKEIADNLDAFQQFRGKAVPVSAVHDTKVVLANSNNYLNPGKNIVDKEAARFFKEVVENNTSSMDVKTYNTELSKYYTVREALEAMDRAVVSGGRMGKYFSSLIGSGVGGLAGGPIGAIVGAEVGAQTRGSMLSRAFGRDVQKGLEATPELVGAMNPTAVGKAAIPDVIIGGKKPVVPDVSLSSSKVAPRAATGALPVVSAETAITRSKKNLPASVIGSTAKVAPKQTGMGNLTPKQVNDKKIVEQFGDIGGDRKLGDNLEVTDAYGKSNFGFNIAGMEKKANETGYPLYEKLLQYVDSQGTTEGRIAGFNKILDEMSGTNKGSTSELNKAIDTAKSALEIQSKTTKPEFHQDMIVYRSKGGDLRVVARDTFEGKKDMTGALMKTDNKPYTEQVVAIVNKDGVVENGSTIKANAATKRTADTANVILQDLAKKNNIDYKVFTKQVDAKLAKAPEWKKHVDSEAEKIIEGIPDTKLATAPIKSKQRIVEKALKEEEGQLENIKDIARNTIVPKTTQARAEVLKRMDARADVVRRKDQKPENFMGYEGTIYNIKTPDGQIVETQVVTPYMTYGKNTEDFSRSVLGDELFEQIKKETGLEPGLGHTYYEQLRTMSNQEQLSEKGQEIVRQSFDYYSKLR